MKTDNNMWFSVVLVLILGYLIFKHFWWLVWLMGGMFILPLAVMFVAWVQERVAPLYTTWKVRDRRKCVICSSWARSIIMSDVDFGGDNKLCKKHSARRTRIWELEKDLGLGLSGLSEN
jgi:hypothetical protein